MANPAPLPCGHDPREIRQDAEGTDVCIIENALEGRDTFFGQACIRELARLRTALTAAQERLVKIDALLYAGPRWT